MISRLAIGHHWAEQPLEGEHDVKSDGELCRDHRPSLRCDELEAMLIYSMSVSVDGYIAGPTPPGWTSGAPQLEHWSEELWVQRSVAFWVQK